MSINQVFLSGNLTRDPEKRDVNGKSVVNFSIATNEGKDRVEFHNCVAWEKTADVIAQYCRKGNRVAVAGRLQTRKWDKDGVTKYSTEIVVFNVHLPPKDSSQPAQQKQSEPVQQSMPVDDMEDEIPF